MLIQQLGKKNRHRRRHFARSAQVDVAIMRRNDLSPHLELQTLLLSNLKCPGAVRNIDPLHVQEVARSISALGFTHPVIVDHHRQLVDGHVRVEAARQLGLNEVPCVIVATKGHESRVLRLALNRLSEKGTWNLDQLRLELIELEKLEIDLNTTGFEPLEIDQIMLPQIQIPQKDTQIDEAAEPIASSGDYFQLGPHIIACGDATDAELVKFLLTSKEVRLVVADTPYNVPTYGHITQTNRPDFKDAHGEMTPGEFQNFQKKWMEAALPFLCDGGLLAPFIDWRGLKAVHCAAEGDLSLKQINLIVWAKTNFGRGGFYRSQHELLPLYKKGSAAHVNNIAGGRKGRSNLWTYPGASTVGSQARVGLKNHPTVKPISMLEDFLLDVTNKGNYIFDPFLGSGSTLLAAENTGRVCIGIDVDPFYIDVAIRQWQAATSQHAVKLGSLRGPAGTTSNGTA